MAPKVAKRLASGPVSSAKKARNPVSSHCKEIVAALQSFGPVDSVRRLLIASVEPTLSDYKDQRHEYQQTVVGWIDEVFAAHRMSLEHAVAEAKTNAEAAVAETGIREAAAGVAEASLVQLSQAAAETQSKRDDAYSQVDAADATLAAAKLAEANFTVDVDAAVAKKQSLEALLSDEGIYAKMKAAPCTKKDADAFVKTVRQNKFDESLVQSLALVFVKEVTARTDFEKFVVQQFEDAVAAKIAAEAKILEEAVPGKQTFAEETAIAEAALATAKAAADASSSAARDAESAVKEGELALKEANKAWKACGPAAKAAASAVRQAESALEAFCSGPLALFQELRDRSPVKEFAQDSAPPPVGDAPAEQKEGDAC